MNELNKFSVKKLCHVAVDMTIIVGSRVHRKSVVPKLVNFEGGKLPQSKAMNTTFSSCSAMVRIFFLVNGPHFSHSSVYLFSEALAAQASAVGLLHMMTSGANQRGRGVRLKRKTVLQYMNTRH